MFRMMGVNNVRSVGGSCGGVVSVSVGVVTFGTGLCLSWDGSWVSILGGLADCAS